MQTESTKDGRAKLWINESEYEKLVQTTQQWEHELLIRILGESGLRVGEAPGVSYSDIQRSSDGNHYFLTIKEAKDTTGEYDGGKERQTWMPADLETDIYRFVSEREISDDASIFSVSKRTLQNWVKAEGERMFEATSQSDWEQLKPHDLRRYFAHYHGDIRGVNPRILMSIGGWESFEALKPYLNKPSERTIINEMTGGSS